MNDNNGGIEWKNNKFRSKIKFMFHVKTLSHLFIVCLLLLAGQLPLMVNGHLGFERSTSAASSLTRVIVVIIFMLSGILKVSGYLF